MTEALQQEIRTLRSLLDSERDPGGRVFAPLADAYRRAGRVPEALRLLNAGLAKHPDFVTGHVVAAQLYVEQGLGAEGQLAARRALELDEENVVALGALLRVLEESGEAEAEEVRARLKVLEPDFALEATRASVPAPTVVREPLEEPPSPDAPTVPLRALGGLSPGAETVEVERPPLEPTVPASAIDLTTLAPFPAAMPLSALAPEPAAMERGFEFPAPATDEAPAEESISLDPLAPRVGGMGGPAVDEPVMDLSALAPEPVFEEPAMELSALAPAPVVDEPVMDLSALAPEPVFEEPVMDLAALAPEPVFEEPVMDLAALAPEPVFEEPVMDLAALAPEPVFEEPVMDLAALAPEPVVEEPVMDLAALAPEPVFDEPVMDLSALAPEPAVEEPVMDLSALAPEPAVEEPVMDLAALAPEPVFDEPVMDLSALAPEPVELGALAPDEEVVSLDTLAPASDTVLDVQAFAPAAEAAAKVAPPVQQLLGFDEPVFDLDTLAPALSDAAGAGEPAPRRVAEEAVDIAFLSPSGSDEIVIDLDVLRPEGPAPALPAPPEASEAAVAAPVAPHITPAAGAEASDPGAEIPEPPEAEAAAAPEGEGEPVYTRTLAELYASQGAVKQAVEVLRHLLAQNPTDGEIARRVGELEASGSPIPTEEETEEEVETLARDLAESGAIRHEVESPFAWADKEPQGPAEVAGPSIREYFDGLLRWEPREDA